MKVKAKLRCLELRGETTHTKWGHVSFNREGLGELEVDEGDLDLLRGLKWLVEEPVDDPTAVVTEMVPEPDVPFSAPLPPPPLPGLPPEPAGEPQAPAEPEPESAGTSEAPTKPGKHTDDTITPPHGNKKRHR